MKARQISPRRKTVKGFTLVELLVAVSLLATLMVALASVMRTMAQTETRVDGRVQQAEELRIATGFLSQVLGRVTVRKWLIPTAPSGAVVAWRATGSSIEWVGIMPARHGLGGRFFFRLQPEDTSKGRSLVLRYLPWEAEAQGFPDWTQATSRSLVESIEHFEVWVEGRPSDAQPPGPEWPAGWVLGWPVADQLPQRLKLKWSTAAGTWPDWVIAVRGLSQGADAGGGFVIGGRK